MTRFARAGFTRREFGTLATVATLGTLLAPPVRTEEKPGTGESPEAAGPDRAKPDDGPVPEARALGEIVRARYPARLDPVALEEIVRGIDGGLQAAARIRKVNLVNADEPAFLFRAWRSDR